MSNPQDKLDAALSSASKAPNFATQPKASTLGTADTNTPKQVAASTPPAAAINTDNIDATGVDILAGASEETLDELARLIAEKQRAKTVVKDAKKHVVDYKMIREQDVFNLNIPIEAISHEAPDFMEVKLADSEYIARWVMYHPARIGVMKSQGFTYVTPEDLGETLKLEIEPDEQNRYRYIDTVLMKVAKIKYFGRLRKNFKRSLDAVTHKHIHQTMKTETDTQIATMDDDRAGFEGVRYTGDFNKHHAKGNIGAYIPGVDL